MNRILFLIILLLLVTGIDIYLFQVMKYHVEPRSRRVFAWIWFGLFAIVIVLMLTSRFFPRQLQLYASNLVMIFMFTKVLVFIPLALSDLAGGLMGWATRATSGFGYLPDRRKFLATAGTIFAAVPFISMIYGLFRTAYDFRIHNIRLEFPNLPSNFKGLRIVQISDIHSGSWAQPEMMKAAFERIMGLQPDLVLFTGDLVNNKTEEAFPFEEYFRMLRAPMGVYASLGNHDYGDYHQGWPDAEAKQKNFRDLLDLYERVGWKLLRNEHVILEKQTEKIALLGVENWSDRSRFRTEGRLDLAYQGTEEIPFKILLSHDPSHWDAEIRKSYPDIDLTLSGHTHGFQFGIEIPGIKWSPSQWLYKQWAGLYREGNQYINVNRGLGCLGFSGRVGIRPEISLIELA